MILFIGFSVLLFAQSGKKPGDSILKKKELVAEKSKLVKYVSEQIGKVWPFSLRKKREVEAMKLQYDSLLDRYVFDVVPEYMTGHRAGIHQIEEEKHLALLRKSDKKYFTEQEWGNTENIVPKTEAPFTVRNPETGTIYGFHPFWLGNAYYNYDFGLLSRVGYFSYSVNAKDGTSNAPFMAHSWRTSPLHAKAHMAGCKVDLVITSYGEKKNSLLLGPSGAAARQTLSDSLSMLLNLKHVTDLKDSAYRGDGITIDFQGFRDDPVAGRELTSFVAGLKNNLVRSRNGSPVSVSLVLPVCAPYKSYEFDSLKKYVDLFIICGYDYYLDSLNSAGPSSVLIPDTTQYYFTLDHSINYYLDKGLPRDKTILSLPWYAKKTSAVAGTPFAATFPGETELFSHSKASILYGSSRQAYRDQADNAVYYPIYDHNGWTQVWTEDTTTLGLKYDYIIKKKLAGTGIWSPGYADQSPEFWELLRKKFCSAVPAPTKSKTNIDSLIAKNDLKLDQMRRALFPAPPSELTGSNTALNYPAVIPVHVPEKNYGLVALFCLVTLLGFALIGFIISLFYESVRDVIFSRDYLLYILAILAVVVALLILHMLGLMADNTIVFIAGGLGGAGLVTLLFRRMRRKNTEEVTP